MNDLKVWGFSVPLDSINSLELEYLSNLPRNLPSVEWVWAELDRVWQAYDLDNMRPLSEQSIGNFYDHPVWLMNGIFTVLDPVSVSHRCAIAKYLKTSNVKSIADYGGGFGELALTINKEIPDASITIIEPYLSSFGLVRLNNTPEIKVVPNLDNGGYDAFVAQDVLEHVEDPVGLAFLMANATGKNGRIIFANFFNPVIQCHLPVTFHLRHTFILVMKALNLRYIGRVGGASHALVFERTGDLNLSRARRVESVSRVIGPTINLTCELLGRAKRLVLNP
jgi:2-polyprenyl-6-hydroxyphenyl methylase/3-demethylubiquinone-9 3-methyltransferase